VINVWNVSKEAVDAQRVGSTAAERVAEQLLEGGADGEFYGEVKDYYLYSQLRAQGEDSTADRLAGIDKPVPTSEIPRLLRALGHYPSERELSDIFRELAVETSGDGDMAADPPATIGFDRFVSLYVNYRPVFGVDAGSIESAFAALGAGAGESVERGSLLEALELGGEAMSREELVAAAAKLMGRGATLEDLVPETVSAREFAEDVLGFVGAAEEIPVDA
jgi:Ca2+-binding EF-hand superfamily protein